MLSGAAAQLATPIKAVLPGMAGGDAAARSIVQAGNLEQPTPSTSLRHLQIVLPCSMDSDDTVIWVGSPAKTSTPGPKADDTPIAEGSAGQLRPKMSGAMRKWYNYWKKKGLSQEEAFDKAKEPWKIIPKNLVENPKPVDKGSEELKMAETPQVPPRTFPFFP
jgi:hypothetical protein